MLRMWYHDVRARIGAHVTGNRKKCVKKVPKFAFSPLFGGDFLHLVHRKLILHISERQDCSSPYSWLWTRCRPPPKKSWRKCKLWNFFHTFFAISRHMSPNTCSNVMILHPNHNSMFLNTFLTLIWCQNYFYALSASRNQNFWQKNRQKYIKKSMYFCRFLVNNFDFLTQRARKNNVNIKLMSETCLGTSNYA